MVVPIVRGLVTEVRVKVIAVLTVVGTLVKITLEEETVQGDGEQPPTLPW